MISRKKIKWSLLVMVICLIASIIFASVEKINNSQLRTQKISYLPNLKIIDINEKIVNIKEFKNKPIVYIHFNTECDYCHDQAKFIKQKINVFSEVIIIFISTESLNSIRHFADYSELKSFPNIFFVNSKPAENQALLGQLTFPHIFIYGKDGYLRKEFKGETKPEAILRYAY